MLALVGGGLLSSAVRSGQANHRPGADRGVEGRQPRAEPIGGVERDTDGVPASGLVLSVRETHAILGKVQAIVLREQA